jgi:hypothetical protein
MLASPRLPLYLSVILALMLVAIGDQFPFSPFPMYAKVDRRAEVFYVTNERDEVVPTSPIFGTSSAQLKKQFEQYLEGIAKTRDYERASEPQLAAAGDRMLDYLFAKLRAHKVARLKSTRLKIWLLSINAESGTFQKSRRVVGERALPEVKS